MRIVKAMAAVGLLAMAFQSAGAQETIGYNKIVVPANSDVYVSVPFTQTAVGTYSVASKSASGVTVTDASWTASAYANTYYVRFISGSASGLWVTITANGTSDLTLDNSDSTALTSLLALVNTGDQFRVYKHQTVGTVFPAAQYNKAYRAGTQILLYNNSAAGQNKSPSTTVSYTLTPAATWSAPNTILKPDAGFVIRNNDTSSLTFVAQGVVPDYTVSYLIPSETTKDIMVSSGYPINTTVGQSGFGGFAGRQVLLYDNSVAGQNKSPSTTVTYTLTPAATWSSPTTVIGLSAGFIFRQNGDAGGVARTIKPY